MSFDFPSVAPAELHRLLTADPGLAVLDVRTPAEYADAHVPQARNEELDTLAPEALFSRGILSRGEPVYLICRTDNRARKAAVKFAEAGHSRVTIVAGGTLGWIAAALPVATGPDLPSTGRAAANMP